MIAAVKRILFASDMSDNSYHACKYAVLLAQLSGAEIHMLHVVEPLSDDALVTLRVFVQNEDDRRKALRERTGPAKAEFEKRIVRFWQEIPEEFRDVQKQVVSAEVIEGHAADQILSRASAKGCDLIVLGTDEHGIRHTYLGTTAKRVLRRANIPTLVVPCCEE